MPAFLCQTCQKNFTIPENTLAKFPGWTPKICYTCKNKNTSSSGSHREENLSLQDVLAKYSSGPVDGVFTDGAAEPNPGRGGWGAVYVIQDAVVAQDYGHEIHTTNNRMELTAILEACRMIPFGTRTIIYTDSQLCVNTFNLWAKGWAEKGWKRKKGGKGEIKNLDLVRRIYDTLQERPEITLQWIQAHSGHKWNEYADSLATAYRRKETVAKYGEKFDSDR